MVQVQGRYDTSGPLPGPTLFLPSSKIHIRARNLHIGKLTLQGLHNNNIVTIVVCLQWSSEVSDPL